MLLMNDPSSHAMQPNKAINCVNSSYITNDSWLWKHTRVTRSTGAKVTGRKRWQVWRGCAAAGGNPVCLPKWYFNLSCGLQPGLFLRILSNFFHLLKLGLGRKDNIDFGTRAATGEVTLKEVFLPAPLAACTLINVTSHSTLSATRHATSWPLTSSLCHSDEVMLSCRGQETVKICLKDFCLHC